MTKKDLISRVVSTLQDHGISKKISMPKQVFHISDDEGNHKDFTVRKIDKGVRYNSNDVAAVIDACLAVIEDSVKRGEEVSIHGFGVLGVHHRAARKTRNVETKEWIEIKDRYVPKFVAGNDLKIAARIYELSLTDSPKEETVDNNGA